MKFVDQKDYPHWLFVTRTDLEEEQRERGKTTTIRSSGCGICSAVMMAHRLIPNCTFDLTAAIDLAYETRANFEVGVNYEIYAPALAQKLGLRLEMTNDIQRLRECLRTGGASVVNVGPSTFTKGGHYVVAINEEPDGRIAILDPDYRDETFDGEDLKGKIDVKCGIIISCTGEILAEGAGKRNPGYYLFWRA